jgi:hypothetical protein
MKLTISVGLFLASMCILALWDMQISDGQEAAIPATTPAPAATSTAAPPSSTPTTAAPGQPAESSRNVQYFLSTSGPASAPRLPGGTLVAIDRAPDFRQAAAALRDAKDDAAKAAAQTQLTELLNNYFEEDMRRREEELAKIETRLKSLREQAARRREKKSEIVELQIKVLLNEAEGLGFFSEAAEQAAQRRKSTGSPLLPVEKAFQRGTWISNDPYGPRPGQAASVAPAGWPTAENEDSDNPFATRPGPK